MTELTEDAVQLAALAVAERMRRVEPRDLEPDSYMRPEEVLVAIVAAAGQVESAAYAAAVLTLEPVGQWRLLKDDLLDDEGNRAEVAHAVQAITSLQEAQAGEVTVLSQVWSYARSRTRRRWI